MFSVIPNCLKVFGRKRDAVISCVRTLFGSGRLGVDGYRQRRTQVSLQLAGSRDEFYKRMERFASGQEQMAFSEELSQLLHVATAEEQDQALLMRMMTRFHEQSKTVRFGSFVFGPVAMRMYWHHQLADKALEAFRSPELEGFFDQLSSYSLLMDLLYKQGRFQDVLATFEEVQSRQLHGTKYPQDCVVLAMAACYQMNTTEAYEYARALLARLEEVGHRMARRAAALAAALLIRQGAAHEALRLLRRRTDLSSALLRDLLAISLAELDRPAEAVETLRQPLLADLPVRMRNNFTVVTEAMDAVEASVQKKKNAEVTANWEDVKKGLESYELVKGKTLEQLLISPILTVRRPPPPSALGASFNRGQPARRSPARPGLADMVD